MTRSRVALNGLFICLSWIILSWMTISFANAAETLEFHVSPKGADGFPGTADNPFATIERAQQAVRQALAEGYDGPGIVVMIAPGDYFLDKPLIFTPADSGNRRTVIQYRPKPSTGGSVRISGGRRLTGFQKNEAGHWVLKIPEVAAGEWNFSQLFVNGQRRARPRWPKTGAFHIVQDDPPKEGKEGSDHNRLYFDGDDLRADWANLEDIELIVFHTWTASRMRMDRVDEKENIAWLTATAGRDQWWSGLRKGRRYFLENVREALSEPGEWYLDKTTGELTYIPMDGENLATAEVIAPRLSHLLKIEADVTKGESVESLEFYGLNFAHTNYVLPKEGYSVAQAEVTLDGAIRADGARRVVFDRCSVAHVAQYAIQFNTGCEENRVVHCDLYDLGGGGVQIGAKVGGGWFSHLPYGDKPLTEAVKGGHNTVENCTIAYGGRIFSAAVGVWIGWSSYNRVAHCDIYDFFYTGISPGWSWGYQRTLSHHNTMEYNHIHTLGQRVLSDMGGIYMLGDSPGTVVRGNRIHDVYSYDYGGWGIYTDEGSTHILIERNLAYNVKDGGFHQHYGKENFLIDNIFAFSDEAQIKRTRHEEHVSFSFIRNIVYWNSKAPLMGGSLDKDNADFDYNIYWNASGEPFDFQGKSFEDWRAMGRDVHGMIADPMFVDPGAGDFTLKAGSPAEAIGFRPFEDQAGRKTRSRIKPDMTRPATAFYRMTP